MMMDLRQRMLQLFGIWSLPWDLHRQSMSWLVDGAYAMELFWWWLIITKVYNKWCAQLYKQHQQSGRAYLKQLSWQVNHDFGNRF